MWQTAPAIRRRKAGSALAGDRDVFAATGANAFLDAGGRNRAGNFVGIDPAVGSGLGKFPRLAVRAGGVRAAFVAPGKAMVDAVAVGLVFNNEDAAVSQGGRSGKQEYRDKKG